MASKCQLSMSALATNDQPKCKKNLLKPTPNVSFCFTYLVKQLPLTFKRERLMTVLLTNEKYTLSSFSTEVGVRLLDYLFRFECHLCGS